MSVLLLIKVVAYYIIVFMLEYSIIIYVKLRVKCKPLSSITYPGPVQSLKLRILQLR